MSSGIAVDRSKTCKLCGVEWEDPMHIAFKCPRIGIFSKPAHKIVFAEDLETPYSPCEYLAGLPLQDVELLHSP